MPWDWTREQAEIYAELATEGQTFTFTRRVTVEFDPVSGTAAVEIINFQAPGLVRRLTAGQDHYFAADTTILQGDTMLLLAGGSYEPAIGDDVTMNAEAFAVKAFSALEPGGVPLLWYVLLGRR